MTSIKRLIGWLHHKPTSRRVETQQQESHDTAKTRVNEVVSFRRPLAAIRSAVTVAGVFLKCSKRKPHTEAVVTQPEEPTFDLTTCHQQLDVLGAATCWTCGEEFFPSDDSELTPNLRQYTLHAPPEDRRLCSCNLDTGPRRAGIMAGTLKRPVCHVCIEWWDTLPMIKQPRTLYRGKIRGPLITFLHLPREVRNQIYGYCLTVFQCSKCPRTATGNCTKRTTEHPLFPDNSAICRVCRWASWGIRTYDFTYLDNDLGQHRALVHVNRRSMGEELRPHARSGQTMRANHGPWTHTTAQDYCPINPRHPRRIYAAKNMTYELDEDRLVGVNQPALIRACRQIREDTLPIWYGNQTFFFTIFGTKARWCQRCQYPPFRSSQHCKSHHAVDTEWDTWLAVIQWLKLIGKANAASIRHVILVYSSTRARYRFQFKVNELQKLGLRVDEPGLLTWRSVGTPFCRCESCVMKALRLDEDDPRVVEDDQRCRGGGKISKADVRHCK